VTRLAEIGSYVTTHGEGGQMMGKLLATAKLDPALRKKTLTPAAEAAWQRLGYLEHAFCIVQLSPVTLTFCAWSTRWPDIFGRVSITKAQSALGSLHELIERHVEIGALEQLTLWDIEALAESLTVYRPATPAKYPPLRLVRDDYVSSNA
jgi:hypothetical protein